MLYFMASMTLAEGRHSPPYNMSRQERKARQAIIGLFDPSTSCERDCQEVTAHHWAFAFPGVLGGLARSVFSLVSATEKGMLACHLIDHLSH